jgi:hypothetical protein
MSWHQPDLYFFLALLTGLAAVLAIIYECIQKFRSSKPPVVEWKCSTVNVKTVDPPRPPKHSPSPFMRLCENMEGAPPNAQARRVRGHFGIFGGTRQDAAPGRKGTRP